MILRDRGSKGCVSTRSAILVPVLIAAGCGRTTVNGRTGDADQPGHDAAENGQRAGASQPGHHVWSKRLAQGNGQSIAVDSVGNVVVVGSIQEHDPTNVTATEEDVLVVKLDPMGRELWQRRFGSAGFESALSVAIDRADAIVIAGVFESRELDFGGGPLVRADNGHGLFIAKLDASGNHVWSKGFGTGIADGDMRVAVDSSDHIVLCGRYWDSIDLGGGALQSPSVGQPPGPGFDLFIAKLDPSGGHVWSKRPGDRPLGSGPFALTVGHGNEVIVAGTALNGVVDLGGGPLGADDVQPFIGRAFVLQLDPAGQHKWSRGMRGVTPYGATVDHSNNVMVVGIVMTGGDLGAGTVSTQDGADAFAAKFDAEGAGLMWAKTFGGQAYQYAFAVATDAHDNLAITGMFYGTIDFGGGPLVAAGWSDMFLVKLGADGQELWSDRFGDALDAQWGKAVAVNHREQILVTGGFASTIDFGGDHLSSGGTVAPGSQWGSDLASFAAEFDP